MEMLLFRLGFHSGKHGGTVAFRPAGGKNNFLGPRSQQSGHIGPGLIHEMAHLAAEGMHAGSIAVQFGKQGQHHLHNFGCNRVVALLSR